MLISIILNFDGTINIDIEKGNHLPRWVESSLGTRLRQGRAAVLDTKDSMETFAQDYLKNGNQYTESMPIPGHFRDSITIKSPEQLKQIFQILNESATVDSKGKIKVTPESFLAAKKGIDLKMHRELTEAYKKGAAAGFFSGVLPPDAGRIIGSHLDTQSAGRLSSSKKSAHASAASHMQERGIKYSEPEITFDEFKTRYESQYAKETFKNPWSTMLNLLKENKINSINQVIDYINQKPKSRAALVWRELANEHAQANIDRVKMKK